MESSSICVVKIIGENYMNSSPINHKELMCEVDTAVENRSYEIVHLDDYNKFSIVNIDQDTQFATYIQFDFPSKLTDSGEIEETIKSQTASACCLEIVESTERYRLIQFEKFDISFK